MMSMSTIAAPTRELTPDDLLEMPDGDRYELVDGRLVESVMSFDSGEVALAIGSLVRAHCLANRSGRVAGADCGYQCFPSHPGRVRRPDVSFIRAERLPPPEQRAEGFISVRPDLAVEVVSPSDRVYDLEEKLDDYRDAGIPLVWLVYPRSRRVRILRLEGPPTELGPDGELTGEDILPGFRCPVADLFSPPPERQPTPAAEPGRTP
jgi:Uma2 family endonuclease